MPVSFLFLPEKPTDGVLAAQPLGLAGGEDALEREVALIPMTAGFSERL